MVIIGITGGIGHGKSSLAEAFREIEPRMVHLESFAVIAEVIDAWQVRSGAIPDPHNLEQVNGWVELLPPILKQLLYVTVSADALRFSAEDIARAPEFYEKLFLYLEIARKDGRLANQQITTQNKAAYRSILQWLGGYLPLKIDSKLWFNELMRRAQIANRQGLQLCVIGGVRFTADSDVIHSNGGYILRVTRPLMGEHDIDDPTERERSRIQPDTTVINNAGLAELEACARHVYTDIKLGKLRTTYAASDA